LLAVYANLCDKKDKFSTSLYSAVYVLLIGEQKTTRRRLLTFVLLCFIVLFCTCAIALTPHICRPYCKLKPYLCCWYFSDDETVCYL